MKKMNNKGFSLVELIVVVLIMAIIAVALAPQVMRWVENSRKSNDIETYNSLVGAINTAGTNEDVITQVKNAGASGIVVSFSKASGVSGLTGHLATACQQTLPELQTPANVKVTSSDWASTTFTITVKFSAGNGIQVIKTNAPVKDFS